MSAYESPSSNRYFFCKLLILRLFLKRLFKFDSLWKEVKIKEKSFVRWCLLAIQTYIQSLEYVFTCKVKIIKSVLKKIS